MEAVNPVRRDDHHGLIRDVGGWQLYGHEDTGRQAGAIQRHACARLGPAWGRQTWDEGHTGVSGNLLDVGAGA